MKAFLLIILMAFTASGNVKSVPLTITIEKMNCSDGNIVVGVYQNDQSFQDDNSLKTYVFPKKDNLRNGVFSCVIVLPEGKYGLAIYDDENADGQMNYNFLGIPKEGFGFSNYYHKGIFRPKYSDFEFLLCKKMRSLKIKLRYK